MGKEEEEILTTVDCELLANCTILSNCTTNCTEEQVISYWSVANPPQELLIVSYTLILFLTVVGNALVIVTLIQNRRMRTVTNVFLLNLAVSDLLLGVFCIPVTLTGNVLRRFIFGAVMCKAMPFLQAVSVSVSVWTLVVISLERYFAICQPLRSRRWQTLSHAYKMIAVVWCISSLFMLPTLVINQLITMRDSDKVKCREKWPSIEAALYFNIFLDVVLLILPLVIMIAAYAMITWCLWQGIQIEKQGRQQMPGSTESTNDQCAQNLVTSGRNQKNSSQLFNFRIPSKPTKASEVNNETTTTTENENENRHNVSSIQRRRLPARPIRSSNFEKSLAAKKHVIRMLFMVVLEFFICWTPLYIASTLISCDVDVSVPLMSYIQLLAFVSACCNPITYCFMNRKFRQAFLQAFGCGTRLSRRGTLSSNGMSFYNRNSTTRTVIEDRELETQL